MLANVINHLTEMDLHLQLVQIGEHVAWRDLETGTLHGTYANIQAAALGLQRIWANSGTHVFFKHESNAA